MRTGGIGEGLFSYTWSFPICPHRVSIGLSIVEALQQELAVGPEPRQGLLFGQKTAGLTHIDGWRRLAALTHDAFADALTAEPGEVVGFYCIRDGSAFILSPAEVAIANASFNRRGAVVLLVERRKKGPAEATFYFWRDDVFVHNLPLPFPFHAGILSGETPGLADVPAPAASRFSFPTRAQRRALRLGLYAVLSMAAGGLLAAYFRDYRREWGRSPEAAVESRAASSAAAWIATEPQRDLELAWDSAVPAVMDAARGVLKIDDGSGPRQISLDKGELLLGAILYAPVSDRIRVELMAVRSDGRQTQIPVAAKSPESPEPVPPPIAAKRDAPVEVLAPAPPSKKPETRPPLRRFTWNRADRAAPASSPAVEPHDVPPPITPHPLSASAPVIALDAPVPPPAPPPKAAPAAPARPVQKSGRVIWTGTLQRRGVVELDGRSVSVGALNGSLPGVPVNLAIFPAEFEGDGLVVYTTDPTKHNRVEPANVANGWNRVKFVWDPERVRQISVLEAPNPNNGYNRIALRNDARRCSMILIDWTTR